ncbi:hypothetical protein LCGC14_2777910 [marine sediment metagenome]|uniref:DUF3310 domain-containing protein n=1 Tax=marine sediment metagenome TaxID=412755 RepID=A0A0F8YU57_9ZZZZ
MSAVDHPTHYNIGSIEVIDAIEDWCLGFHLGNVVKYIARAPHKGKLVEDLKKARWYLQRFVDRGGTARDDGFDGGFSIAPHRAALDWKLPAPLASIVHVCARRGDLGTALDNLTNFISGAEA